MSRNAILLRGDKYELGGVADEAITPGMLVEPTSTGWRRHNTAAGAAAQIWCREQHELSTAGSGGIDDAIALGDDVPAMVVGKGAKINAVTADTIAVGGLVESDGDGGVRARGSGVALGVATTASDLSGSVGRVEIITI